MPKFSGRGRTLRTRTVTLPGGAEYIVCDVYEKPGPQGGRTVCSPPRKKKGKK